MLFMHSLGEKRDLFKDFNFASSEVIYCLKKAGINSDVKQVVIADSDDPYKDLHENLNNLISRSINDARRC